MARGVAAYGGLNSRIGSEPAHHALDIAAQQRFAGEGRRFADGGYETPSDASIPMIFEPSRSPLPNRHLRLERGQSRLRFDSVECIDCGAYVPVCPVAAIFAFEDLPEKWADFTQRNGDYYQKR